MTSNKVEWKVSEHKSEYEKATSTGKKLIFSKIFFVLLDF